MKISVLIITRNRAALLDQCLDSLLKQKIKPDEVVVIDNGSINESQMVCDKYRRKLRLVYQKEARPGIPFARNLSLKTATGQIFAFLDDDCLAGKNWIFTIQKIFHNYPGVVGLVGFSSPVHRQNIPSLIEDVYHYRWVLQHVTNPRKFGQISSGQFVDFKNAALRAGFIKKIAFRTDVPFGDVGNEDAEMGTRLYPKNSQIFYAPNLKVKHLYSSSVKRLLIRNFWSGYSDQMLKRQNGININEGKTNYCLGDWLAYTQKQVSRFSLVKQIQILILFIVYPLWSKAGRAWANITYQHKPYSQLPVRL